MTAAMHRAQALAGAGGLSPGQHRFWASTAAGEKKRLAVLHKELATERAWRYQLQLNELGLDRQIRAAGNLPGLRRARPRVESPDGPGQGHHRGHQQDARLLRRVPEGAPRAQAPPRK